MTKIEQAKQIVLNYPFNKNELDAFAKDDVGVYAIENARGYYFDGDNSSLFEKLTPEILAMSLNYIIDLETGPPSPAIGCSKKFGAPHLPADWKTPSDWKKMEFWFQINFEEVKPFDKENLFPEKGIVYVFQNPGGDTCKLHYYAGTTDKLVKRTDITSLPGQEAAISFSPKFIFYVGADAFDYSEIYSFIPEELRKNLEELLECEMAKEDSCERMLGKPIYWQGEDEDFELIEDEDEFENDREDEPTEPNEPSVLFFNGEINDSTVHIRIPLDELKKGNFANAWETFSGT